VSAPLTIGLDVRPALLTRTGIGRVARELHLSLSRRAGLRVVPFAAMARRPRADLQLPGVRAPLLPARLQRVLAPLGFSAESLLGPLDVFQHTDLVFAPVARAAPVVIVHDLCYLAGERWHDPDFARHVGPRVAAAAAAARAVVVPSPRVAADIAAHGFAPPDRVHVVPWGADHMDRLPAADDAARLAALRRRTGLPDAGPLVLLPGTREPRKNQLAALAAFLRARGAAPGAPAVLLLAGPAGWGCPELEARLADPALACAVGVAGELEEPDLVAALRGADIVLYPSLAEGFGLPVAEALRCGRAVVTSTQTPMADFGGEAVLAVDPRDATALEQALAALLADPARREALGAAGRRAVAPLTWDAVAERLHALYRALAGGVDSATA
jgi:glycosyltransferase involved in cell wall biosynthesis